MTGERPAHSPLGASGAHQWMACPGSVIASIGHDNESSLEAMTGSAAHVIGEICLTQKREPWQFVKSFVNTLGDTYSNSPHEKAFDADPSMIKVDVEMGPDWGHVDEYKEVA